MLKNKISKLLPKRKQATHKGDYGRVLIVAGSAGMTGAAVLAARGALRSGAGLTYLAVPKNLVNFVDAITPEVITLPFKKIKTVKADAIAFGPGLRQSSKINKLLHSFVIRHSPLVIDADGLNTLAKDLSILKKAKAKIILTPHPGEMSRLAKKSVKYIQKNRVLITKQTARRLGCIVVLKGYKTVIADSSGQSFVNTTGNPGMATGGVGDVLTGMITGFLAQGIVPWEAAVLGVYLHGLAGDLAARELGEYGMIAGDLVEKIPYAIRKIN